MEALVARTGESCSIAQLDGSDIVYVARVAVPKIVALRVDIGTRFPALADLAGQGAARRRCPTRELDAVLPSRPARASSPGTRRTGRSATRRCATCGPRAGRSPTRRSRRGIRSVAAPLRDGSGRVFAAMNVTVHAAETSVATLTAEYLPLLLQTAGEVSADFARCQAVPVAQTAG